MHCTGARAYLDALAHLASTPLALMRETQCPRPRIRMTILAGVDAVWFAKRFSGRSKRHLVCKRAVDLVIRWTVPGGEGVPRTNSKRCNAVFRWTSRRAALGLLCVYGVP